MTQSEVQRSLEARAAQDRLVEAAEVLFCERGFNETSVRDIAAAAGCNVASVNYYFGGKDNLYVEVWHRMLASIREARLTSIDSVMSPLKIKVEIIVSTGGRISDIGGYSLIKAIRLLPL